MQTLEKKTLIYIGISLCLLMAFKSIVLPLTYDEAYSFLFYALPGDFFSTSLANNHPLNTLLIWFFTKFSDSELWIRMPNLLFGLLYIYLSYSIAHQSRSKILTFAIFTTCPYLSEFFSLARGYGISASLIFFGITLYYFKSYKNSTLLASTILLLLSAYSFYPSIILCGVFLIIVTPSEWKQKNYRHLIASCSLSAIGAIYPIWAMHIVSGSGKPLYGGSPQTFFETIKSGVGLLTLYNPTSTAPGFIVAIFILTLACTGAVLSDRSRKLFLTSIAFLVIYFGAAIVASRPVPTHRLLVPFVPIILATAVSALDDILDKSAFLRKPWIAAGLTLLLILNFLLTLRIQDTYDWHDNKVNPNSAIRFDIKDGKCFNNTLTNNPAEDYYIRKEFIRGHPVCDHTTGNIIKP